MTAGEPITPQVRHRSAPSPFHGGILARHTVAGPTAAYPVARHRTRPPAPALVPARRSTTMSPGSAPQNPSMPPPGPAVPPGAAPSDATPRSRRGREPRWPQRRRAAPATSRNGSGPIPAGGSAGGGTVVSVIVTVTVLVVTRALACVRRIVSSWVSDSSTPVTVAVCRALQSNGVKVSSRDGRRLGQCRTYRVGVGVAPSSTGISVGVKTETGVVIVGHRPSASWGWPRSRESGRLPQRHREGLAVPVGVLAYR